ncbi:MAG: NAD(P)-dependent oxidoreductase [Proteobacteria bacterium]|nr:MAG: NAD(P)-dependent oxidoreductase [Pseudomonadota bacterium]
MPQQIWIIGCGDIGQRVVKQIDKRYQHVPHKVNALIQGEASEQVCKKLGLTTLRCDLDKMPHIVAEQFTAAEVYYFVPPPSTADTDTRLTHFLNQVGAHPKRIVLISTTGVYGDSQGQWIDEETTVNPQTDRSKRRLSAEKQLQQWAAQHNREYIILRVPGIYAKERLPLARLRKKLPVIRASEAAYTNRIHADDLANICIVAMQSHLSGEIFNVTDGHPGTMLDYFNRVADFAGLERPPQISLAEAKQQLSEGMLFYAMESRRIRNDKLLNMLNVTLKYPTLESALK